MEDKITLPNPPKTRQIGWIGFTAFLLAVLLWEVFWDSGIPGLLVLYFGMVWMYLMTP